MDRKLFPRTPRLNCADAESLRTGLRDYFHATFDRYERLFEVLGCDEAYYKKPISLRHPLIFYYGHTATFFINKLLLAGLVSQRVNPRFESLFAVGVDEMSWDDLDEAHYDWPAVAEVKAYRDAVRDVVDGLIRTKPLELPLDWRNPWWAIAMGIEHERIHLETSSVLIRQHELRYVKRHPDWQPCRDSGPAPLNGLVRIPAGPVRLGQDNKDWPYYGWDNEFGVHIADVTEFQATRFLVSNGEFLEFVEAGAYADDAVWEEEGRGWKNFAQAGHPTFWVKDGDSWKLRLMLEEIAMPWDWPVEVNYHEAKAFCVWKKNQTGLPVRLPTEDEWHRLRAYAGLAEIVDDKPAAANIHLDHYASSCPVNQFQQGGLFDVIGNVWQWTETPIYPFEGFQAHPIYDDFTTPTYDGRHNLFKGGSWISCGNEALSHSRYAFRRHFFQHAGFRYVVSDTPPVQPARFYETDPELASLAEAHYGEDYFGVANFPKALAGLGIKAMAGKPAVKALDLGCGAGRASFELARHFAQVVGIDSSARIIGLGTQCAETGVLRYTLADEGELVFYKERKLADFGLDGSLRGKVEFWQGDACNLKPMFSGFDLILASHLDRLYSPAKLLETIHERLNPGGLLVISSAYAWNKETTQREAWLGGFKKDGESFTTLDGLREILGGHFRLVTGPVELPQVIRESRRSFRHVLMETTVWENSLSFDFDTVIPREGSASVKWDGSGAYFGSQDLIPMWVADMDFAVPEAVSRAVRQRAEHPVFGYTLATDGVYESLIHWLKKRHGWEVQKEWIILSPGVVPSLHAAAIAFAGAQEGVIVQPPVYFPFFSAVTETDRRLILNPLRLDNGHYSIDFDHLGQCAQQGAKLLMLCTPHNPVGRVWSEAELREVLKVARRHGLVILSDEIHHDLIFPESSHIPLNRLAEAGDQIVTAVAPSKTFNIPGLGLSALIVPDANHRAALRKAFELLHLGASNPFSLVAFEAAYRDGEAWLEALLAYLTQTRDYVAEYLASHIPKIKLIQPEGTYLLWLDCRELGMADSELKRFFIHQAKVGMNPGIVFGEGGSGFMRMNIGASRLVVAGALERMARALESHGN